MRARLPLKLHLLAEWRPLLLLCTTAIFGFLFAEQLTVYHAVVVSQVNKVAQPFAANLTIPFSFTRSPVTGLQCVKVMPHSRRNLSSDAPDAAEEWKDLSEYVSWNQAAFFLASHFDTKLALPTVGQGPIWEKFRPYVNRFDKCGPATLPDKCVFKMDDFVYNVCPRGHCECMAAQFAPDIQQIVDRGCPTVGVLNDRFKRLEFSGCLSVLKRHLSTKGAPPAWQYDVLQYRPSDFRNYTEKKTPTTPGLQFWLVLKQLCLMSNRDIVVITDRLIKVPVCGKRVVLAAGLTQLESMQIAQHARIISVGPSVFGHSLMEVAQPERVLMDLANAEEFEYVNVENWTLTNTMDGTAFHFNTREFMLENIMSARDLRTTNKFRRPEKLRTEVFSMAVPPRIWKPDMMKPAILQNL